MIQVNLKPKNPPTMKKVGFDVGNAIVYVNFPVMNYKIVFLLSIVSILPIEAKSQSKNCSNFKTGNFYTETPNLGRTLITRNDTLQIEINERVGYHYVHTVEWISECEYRLTLLENKSTDPKFNPPTNPLIMSVRIIKTDKDSFETQANLNGGEFRYGGVIKKIKD